MKITKYESTIDALHDNFILTVEFRGDRYYTFDNRQIEYVSDVYQRGLDCGICLSSSAEKPRRATLLDFFPVRPAGLIADLKVEKVIFNDPATIVFWNDGSKTVVKCGEGETFDEEKGFAIACTKKMFGNNHIYYGKMQKAIEKAVRKETDNDNFKK